MVVPAGRTRRRNASSSSKLTTRSRASASIEAGETLLARAHGLGEKDLAICVFTGGSSALACLPAPGISAEDKIVLHRLLLSSPMSIVEINTVRKHTSAMKGGRLARALSPATILNLSVSDVVGDPLDCITDLTVRTRRQRRRPVGARVAQLHGTVPPSVVAHLRSSPDAQSPSLEGIDIESVLVTRGRDGSDAVVAEARARGLRGVRLGEQIEGEASTVGRLLATLARGSRLGIGPFERGSVLVACGGECTVSLGTDGRDLFGPRRTEPGSSRRRRTGDRRRRRRRGPVHGHRRLGRWDTGGGGDSRPLDFAIVPPLPGSTSGGPSSPTTPGRPFAASPMQL